jgi:hypothetical protein
MAEFQPIREKQDGGGQHEMSKVSDFPQLRMGGGNRRRGA